MNVVECPDISWSKDPVSTERDSYRFLITNPLVQDVDYYAVPWADLINSKKLHLAQALPATTIPAFTICQHIHFAKIKDFIAELDIDALFTPHASKAVASIGKTQIRAFPHSPVNATNESSEKEFLFSFVGTTRTHWTRNIIAELKGGYVKTRRQWHFRQSNRPAERREYREILSKSVFSLCPRGSGPGTIRFWETLKSGVIPVLIADELVLPSGINWSDCVIRIPEDEKAIQSIPDLLGSLDSVAIESMCNAVRATWKQFEGPNLVSPISNWVSGDNYTAV